MSRWFSLQWDLRDMGIGILFSGRDRDFALALGPLWVVVGRPPCYCAETGARNCPRHQR